MLPNILNVILEIFSKTKTVADVIGLLKKMKQIQDCLYQSLNLKRNIT